MKFVCGYARIFTDLTSDNRDGFTDYKDASRTIRTGFTDRFWLGFFFIHFMQFDVNTSIFGSLQLILYMFEDIFC